MKYFLSRIKNVVVGIILMASASASTIAAEPMIRWLGHAALQYSTRSGKIILIDPWLTNPKAPKNAAPSRVDLILITHGHQDHVGEAFDLAKKFQAPIVASHELTEIAKKNGIQKVIPINPSGAQRWEGVTIHAVNAIHSSSINDGTYAGAPLGFVVEEDGVSAFYHAGDTGVFSDMQLIAELYHPAVVFLPIGSIYTMGPAEAALAARALQARVVVPIHFGTFPALAGTPEQLKLALKRIGVLTPVREMTPGENVSLASLTKS